MLDRILPRAAVALPLLVAPLLPAPAMAAATIDERADTVCKLQAWSNDKDPKGTNIRAAPNTSAPIVGKLPGPREDEEVSAEVDVIGSRAGWFLISAARMPEVGDKPARPLFSGRGWVSGRLLVFSTEARQLRVTPQETAPVVAELTGTDAKGESWGFEQVKFSPALACSGAFVEFDAELPDGRRAHGWADRICANQLTTCP